MKKLLLLALGLLMLTSCYNRIGDLTVVSNHNFDTSAEYVLVARNVEATAKTKKGDPLESAIDNLVIDNKGDHLRNVKIFVKNNGKKIKVVGDVYGDKRNAVNVTQSVNEEIKLENGDSVSFKFRFKRYTGKILGINKDGAVVEFENAQGKTIKKEFSFDQLTKIEK